MKDRILVPQPAHTDLLSSECTDWLRHMTGVLTRPTVRAFTGSPSSCCEEDEGKNQDMFTGKRHDVDTLGPLSEVYLEHRVLVHSERSIGRPNQQVVLPLTEKHGVTMK